MLWLLDNIIFLFKLVQTVNFFSCGFTHIVVPVLCRWDWVRINCVCFHCHQWNRKDDNWDLLTTRKTVESLVSVSVFTRWVSPTVQNDLHQQTQSRYLPQKTPVNTSQMMTQDKSLKKKNAFENIKYLNLSELVYIWPHVCVLGFEWVRGGARFSTEKLLAGLSNLKSSAYISLEGYPVSYLWPFC